MPVTLF